MIAAPIRETLSLTYHGLRMLYLCGDSDFFPSFVEDAAGRLVFLSSAAPLCCPFPADSRLLSFRNDADPPLPWLWDRKTLAASIERLYACSPIPLIDQLQQCYPNYWLRRSDFICAPIVRTGDSDSDLLAYIDATTSRTSADPEDISHSLYLKQRGVVPIPHLPQWSDIYHRLDSKEHITISEKPLRLVEQGWLRDGRVLRFSLFSLIGD